jgi:SAM-dependent methyltransferase
MTFYRQQGEVFFEAIRDLELPISRLMLDFGCGVGRLAGPLAPLAVRYVGVDIVTKAIAKAREEHKDVSSIEFYPIEELGQFPDEAALLHIDRIMLITVLQHMPIRAVRHWADIFRRKTTSEAEFIIIDDAGPLNQQTGEHVFRRSPKDIAGHLGFTILSKHPVHADHGSDRPSHFIIHGKKHAD